MVPITYSETESLRLLPSSCRLLAPEASIVSCASALETMASVSTRFTAVPVTEMYSTRRTPSSALVFVLSPVNTRVSMSAPPSTASALLSEVPKTTRSLPVPSTMVSAPPSVAST